jgi:hypothetical protein
MRPRKKNPPIMMWCAIMSAPPTHGCNIIRRRSFAKYPIEYATCITAEKRKNIKKD